LEAREGDGEISQVILILQQYQIHKLHIEKVINIMTHLGNLTSSRPGQLAARASTMSQVMVQTIGMNANEAELSEPSPRNLEDVFQCVPDR
jgi:hypothetical protein